MANTKNPKIKSAKSKNEQKNFILSMIVALAMVASGLFYFFEFAGNTTPVTTTDGANQTYLSYAVTPFISSSPIIVKVDEPQNQYIALIDSNYAKCVSYQVIGWVYNMSIPGIAGANLEAADPVPNAQQGAVCANTFLMFRFNVNNPDNETVSRLTAELNNRIGRYFLKRVYSSTLMNASELTTSKVDVIGNLDLLSGDTVEITVLTRADNSFITFEKQKLYVGSTVPGTVLSLTDTIVTGTINDTFNATDLGSDLSFGESSVSLPKILTGSNLTANQTGEISKLSGVTVEPSGNVTRITFNSSLAEIETILLKDNITHSITNGSASYQLPLNTSMTQAQKILEDRGLVDVQFKRSGQVQLPANILVGGEITPIPNYANYTVVLEPTAKPGDKINVSLSIIQFGTQTFIAGAKQVT